MEMRSYEELMARHAEKQQRAAEYRLVQKALAGGQRPGPIQRLLAALRRFFADNPVPAVKKG